MVVYKTPDSQLAAQGLAGTIDLRTIRPLTYGKPAVALNFRGEQNSNDNLGANSDDQRLSRELLVHRPVHGRPLRHRLRLRAPRYADSDARLRHLRAVESVGRRRTDDTARAALQVAASQQSRRRARPVRDQRHESPRGHGLDGARRLHGNARSSSRPTATRRSSTCITRRWIRRTMRAASRSTSAATRRPAAYPRYRFPDGTVFGYSDTTIENDTVVAGTLNNITPLARNFLFTTEDEILAGGWRNEFQLSDAWSLAADISYSKATRDQLQYEIESQMRAEPLSSTRVRSNFAAITTCRPCHSRWTTPIRRWCDWSARRSMEAATRRSRMSRTSSRPSAWMRSVRRDMGWFCGHRLWRQLQRPHQGQVLARNSPQHDRRRRSPGRGRVPVATDRSHLRATPAKRWRST